MNLTPPSADEAAAYYSTYIDLAIERGDVLAALSKQIDELQQELGSLSDEQARFTPGPAEWTIKEVVGHLIDTERVFAYRLTCLSRKEQNPLPGFDQDDYVREGNFNAYALADLLKEFEFTRKANLIAIQHLPEAALNYRGVASGNPVSVRALIHIMVGHVEHHRQSLRRDYLPKVG
ncbi:MAG: DinB family protein [Anaerolineales bacterium]|nr:DinB family protein [Anaerolineales bacterium]